MEVINVYKSFWYLISCCQTRSGSSFLRLVWVLGSWSLWVLGNLLCLTPHMASLLLSLISFSVLHSIDVISSSNRPLLFYSLSYSSLFLSLWFWRFYVFYHFYLKWFTLSFFVFTFSFLPSHFNLECLFCHITEFPAFVWLSKLFCKGAIQIKFIIMKYDDVTMGSNWQRLCTFLMSINTSLVSSVR